MKLAQALAVGCVVAAAVLSSAPASSLSTAVGCRPEAGKRIVASHDHLYTLLVGKAENMFMPRQVRASHLKHGEEMLRGRMSQVELLVGGPIRHLEVQICSRTTRAVVTSANPRIVVDDATKGTVVTLPISVMEGIGEGVADLHYGNNLAMPAGHRFLISVTWRGERAVFRYVAAQARHRSR